MNWDTEGYRPGREGSMGRSGNTGEGAREPGDRSLGVPCSPHVAGGGGGDGGGGSVQGMLGRPLDRQEGFPQGFLGRVLARSLGSLLALQKGSLGRVLDPPSHASFVCSRSLPHPLFAGFNLQRRSFR